MKALDTSSGICIENVSVKLEQNRKKYCTILTKRVKSMLFVQPSITNHKLASGGFKRATVSRFKVLCTSYEKNLYQSTRMDLAICLSAIILHTHMHTQNENFCINVNVHRHTRSQQCVCMLTYISFLSPLDTHPSCQTDGGCQCSGLSGQSYGLLEPALGHTLYLEIGQQLE